jgi:hypothetical protein
MGEKRRRDFHRLRAKDRLGDQPVQAEYYDKMTAVVRAIDVVFNGKAGGPGRKVGFVL